MAAELFRHAISSACCDLQVDCLARLSLEVPPVCLEHLHHLGLPLLPPKPPTPLPFAAHPRRPQLLVRPLAADLGPSQTSISSLFSQRTPKLANPAGDDMLLQVSRACLQRGMVVCNDLFVSTKRLFSLYGVWLQLHMLPRPLC